MTPPGSTAKSCFDSFNCFSKCAHTELISFAMFQRKKIGSGRNRTVDLPHEVIKVTIAIIGLDWHVTDLTIFLQS